MRLDFSQIYILGAYLGGTVATLGVIGVLGSSTLLLIKMSKKIHGFTTLLLKYSVGVQMVGTFSFTSATIAWLVVDIKTRAITKRKKGFFLS